VDVRDAVTRKRVSRTLDLRAIPADARPLAIAVGTDELLIASWMEVAVSKPAARDEPPEQVARAVSEELRSDPRAEVAAAGTYDSFDGGENLLGIDVRGRWFLSDRLAAAVRLGFLQGREADAPNGTVQTSAWLAGVGARLAATPPSPPFGADVFGRVDALGVSYVPDAGPEAVGHPRKALAVVGSAGIAGRFRASSTLRFSLEGAIGVPFRPVHATDSGARFTSLAGFVVSGGGEIALVF
jgi:hypothetical protein